VDVLAPVPLKPFVLLAAEAKRAGLPPFCFRLESGFTDHVHEFERCHVLTLQQFNAGENFPTKFTLKPKLGMDSLFTSFAQVGRGWAALARFPACIGLFERRWATGCKVYFAKKEPRAGPVGAANGVAC
jgi:hypothetical protein